MFKKIREYKDAYQQGRLDSLVDSAYLMAIVLVSLIYDITVETDTQLWIEPFSISFNSLII